MRDPLSDPQRQRFSRQILLPSFGFDGQEALLNASVLMIGVGGLGCAAAQYLVAAGVGCLTLVDFDRVDVSNLHRQVLYGDADKGRFKTESAVAALRRLNAGVELRSIAKKLADEALFVEIKDADVVMDCSDNLATRQQLNRLCKKAQVPLVSGAAVRLEGQVAVFPMTQDSPCYHCFSHTFGEQQLSCVESGVLGPVVGIVGAFQALEAIKVISGLGVTLAGRVMLLDATYSEWQSYQIERWADCPVCGSESSSGGGSGSGNIASD